MASPLQILEKTAFILMLILLRKVRIQRTRELKLVLIQGFANYRKKTKECSLIYDLAMTGWEANESVLCLRAFVQNEMETRPGFELESLIPSQRKIIITQIWIQMSIICGWLLVWLVGWLLCFMAYQPL